MLEDCLAVRVVVEIPSLARKHLISLAECLVPPRLHSVYLTGNLTPLPFMTNCPSTLNTESTTPSTFTVPSCTVSRTIFFACLNVCSTAALLKGLDGLADTI